MLLSSGIGASPSSLRSRLKWTPERNALLGFGLAFVLLAFVNISGFYTIRAFTSNAQWVGHTREVMLRLDRIWAALLECESGSRAFVITRDETFVERLEEAGTSLHEDTVKLARLIADNPAQVRRFEDVRDEMKVRMSVVANLLRQVREGHPEEAVEEVVSRRGKRSMDRIRGKLREMQRVEGDLLSVRDARLRQQFREGFVVLTAGCILQLLILAFVIAVFRRDGRRRRAMVARLAEMSALQQATLDATHYAVISTNDRGGITFFNRGAEQMLGYTAAEMVGRETPEIFHDREDLAQRARETSIELGENLSPDYASLVARARRGLSDERPCLFRRKDGTTVPVTLDTTPMRGPQGEIVGYLGIARDISTRLKTKAEADEANRERRSMMEAIPDIIVMTTPSGALKRWNTQLETVTGLNAAGLKDCSVVDLFRASAEGSLEDFFAQVVRDERGTAEVELAGCDGRAIPHRFSAAPLWGPNGGLIGLTGVLQDVTVQRELYRQMEEARAAAENASLAKGMFLANMSHEIRTPLNGVIGMNGLLLETELSPRQRHFAGIVNSSAESLLRLLNDLLDLSKVEAGMLELERIDFDVRTVVEQAVGIHTAKAIGKKITLAGIVAPGVPAMVQGDPARLEQVLVNLVGNAVKFTEAGEVTVRVDLASENALRFEVRDTGIGISEAGQRRLFTAFMQEDGSTTRRFGGTGLGLAISRKIVEQTGGEIGVRSEPGVGSTFTFSLPVGMASRPGAIPPDIFSAGLRALVCDEKRTVSESLAAMLESWGGSARIADSAEAMLEPPPPGEKPYDVVLLDPRQLLIPVPTFVARARSLPALADAHFILIRSLEDKETHGDFPELRKPVGHSQLLDLLVECFQLEAFVPKYEGSAAEPAPTGGLCILAVEDNPVNLTVLTHLLQKGGHRIVTARDGEEAVRLAAQHEFDLILMDCEMPRMNGYEAASAIRAGGSRVPLVALTAHAMEGDRERCLAAGMDDCLSKPIRSAEIEHLLAQFGAAPASGLERAVVEELRQIRDPGGSSVFDRLVDLFQQNSPELLAKARRALEISDHDGLRRAAHTLKGSGATFGARRLAHFCQQIEELAGSGQDLAKAGALLALVGLEYESVLTELNEETHCTV